MFEPLEDLRDARHRCAQGIDHRRVKMSAAFPAHVVKRTVDWPGFLVRSLRRQGVKYISDSDDSS
jgi:hypothetical protein